MTVKTGIGEDEAFPVGWKIKWTVEREKTCIGHEVVKGDGRLEDEEGMWVKISGSGRPK